MHGVTNSSGMKYYKKLLLFLSALVLFWMLPSPVYLPILFYLKYRNKAFFNFLSMVWIEPILIKEGRLKMDSKSYPIVSLFFKFAG